MKPLRSVINLFLVSIFCLGFSSEASSGEVYGDVYSSLIVKPLEFRGKGFVLSGNVGFAEPFSLNGRFFHEGSILENLEYSLEFGVDYSPASQVPEFRRSFSTALIFRDGGIMAKLREDLTRSEFYKEDKSTLGIYGFIRDGLRKVFLGGELFKSDYSPGIPTRIGAGATFGYFDKNTDLSAGISYSTDKINYNWGISVQSKF